MFIKELRNCFRRAFYTFTEACGITKGENKPNIAAVIVTVIVTVAFKMKPLIKFPKILASVYGDIR